MRIFNNFNLTDFNSYKIKAVCKKVIFFDKEEEIVNYYLDNFQDNTVILGSGHNIILSKEYYEDTFIIFNGNFSEISFQKPNVIEAEAGASMFNISTKAYENGLSGLEVFYDIPSSLGGAVVMNAGASGNEIKDVVEKIRYLDLSDKKIKEVDKAKINFEYRNSIFQKDKSKIVLKAWLKLLPKNKEEIKQKMELLKQSREAKQPKDFPNAGSVFKRPTGYYVGTMIEELGMKGLSVGEASVSEKHAGFIINKGHATGKDIVELIKKIQQRVKEKYGIDLIVEQRII